MADEALSRDANFQPVIGGIKDTSGDISQIRVDETTQRLLTDSTDVAFSTVGNGSVTIISGGEVKQLSTTSTATKRIFVQASENSTGPILVGGSSVAATATLRQGLALYPTQGVWLRADNLDAVYVTSTTAGDACHFYYEV